MAILPLKGSPPGGLTRGTIAPRSTEVRTVADEIDKEQMCVDAPLAQKCSSAIRFAYW
jgi:hypothetical protein